MLFAVIVALFLTFMVQGCKEDMGLNPNDYFTGQQLLLAESIEKGDAQNVKNLAAQTDLNKPGEHEMTLLFWALGNAMNEKKTADQLNIVTLLVKAGADPLQPRSKGKSSPAEFVLMADSGVWIKALLDGGLSPNAKDKTFDKPIVFQSIKAKNTETLKVMLDYGADINTVNSLGSTLLFEALNYHAYDHVFLLLERGADPEIRADNGWTMVNQLQRLLNVEEKDSDEYKMLIKIKDAVVAHGGKWPPAPVK
ncbi:ankyrin repeat domain-containing protein [Enterobacter cloacae]|uniref:Ankyrin repeat domain-containing protein n=2 Tax=Enterobacteriaceae TaxID=543 RepID=A0A4Q2EFB6_ENTCL|nr:ankyrin repeat domain-containing protein [Enterobacter cloacae]